MRVFENRELRRILGPKRDEVTEEWRRWRSEELNDLYSPNITRAIKPRRKGWAGRAACTVARRGAKRIFMGKFEGKRPLGRPRCR